MFPVSFISDGLAQNMALAHYNRVIANGGVLPAGIPALTSILNSVISAYGITSATDFNTKVPVFLDPHYTGYKLGAGSGTTLGQAAQTVYSINSSADVTQATAASQPLLLPYSGVNYYWCSGVVSNYCSTPNAAANQITGNLEIIVNATALDWGQNYGMLVSKYTTALNGNFYFCTRATKKLEYAYSNGTTAPAKTTTVNTPFTNNTNGWLKVVHNVSTGNVSIYYSTDAVNTNPNSVSWTLLESMSGTAESRLNYATPIEIGSNATGQNNLNGKIYRATISNSIGGTPVVDFNPASYSASVSQTGWTSATGEAWTINVDSGTGTGYRGILVDKTVLMSDGIDDSMVNTFGLATVKSIYNAYTIWNTLATGSLFASNNGTEVIDANMNSTAFIFQLDNAASSISIATTGTERLRTLRTAVINGANSLQRLNNGTASTGTLGASLSTSMKIMQERNGSYKSKMIYSSLLVSGQADTTLQQTAIYNIIRSMNGNAF